MSADFRVEPNLEIALLGHYGHRNMGDSLLSDCLSQVLSLGRHNVTVYSDAAGEGAVSGLECQEYLAADVIVIGGGGIIQDTFWAFRDGCIDALLAAKKPMAVINVGVTPEYLTDAVFCAKLRALEAAWWVRDKESVRLLAEISIQAELLPDVSFNADTLPIDRPARTLPKENSKENSKRLFVCLNHYALEGLWSEEATRHSHAMSAARILAHFFDWMAEFGWQIAFYPAQTAFDVDDRHASSAVYSLMRRKDSAHWITDSLHWSTTAMMISASDLVVSQRFHVTTLALSLGVPVVDIPFHAKAERLLSETGCPSASMAGLTQESLVRAAAKAEVGKYQAYADLYQAGAQEAWSDFSAYWAELLSAEFNGTRSPD